MMFVLLVTFASCEFPFQRELSRRQRTMRDGQSDPCTQGSKTEENGSHGIDLTPRVVWKASKERLDLHAGRTKSERSVYRPAVWVKKENTVRENESERGPGQWQARSTGRYRRWQGV